MQAVKECKKVVQTPKAVESGMNELGEKERKTSTETLIWERGASILAWAPLWAWENWNIWGLLFFLCVVCCVCCVLEWFTNKSVSCLFLYLLSVLLKKVLYFVFAQCSYGHCVRFLWIMHCQYKIWVAYLLWKENKNSKQWVTLCMLWDVRASFLMDYFICHIVFILCECVCS